MPRPKQYEDDRVQIQFRLTTSLRDRLKNQADERMVATNFLIEKALEESLAKWEKEMPSKVPTRKPRKVPTKRVPVKV